MQPLPHVAGSISPGRGGMLMESDFLHGQIFDAVKDPLVVIDGRGNVYAANAAALRLFDLAIDADSCRARPVRFALDVRPLAELVSRSEKASGVPIADRTGRDTGIVVDVDPSVGPPGHALLHFRARTDALARELWTDDAVAAVAHEFRNPLSAMRSALGVLSRGDAGFLPENQRRFVDAVERGVSRLARIVDGYLDLGRVRAGVLTIDRGNHDVTALLAGIMEELRVCHPDLIARMDVTIAADARSAFVDSDRITQVLLNLIYNAARFTPDGKRLAVRARAAGREALADAMRVLPFDVLGDPRLVSIEVEDEGIGMSAEALEHVFERYHADARDAADAPEISIGAHLGLHIARALVDAQDGWMRMESRLGEGTTASVFVPADVVTARLFSRLRGAEEAVQRLRAARRPATVALIVNGAIRADSESPVLWPSEWAVNSTRTLSAPGQPMVWVVRDGLALLVTPRAVPLPRTGPDDERSGISVGVCRVEEGMTFSGALRSAAASLKEQTNHRDIRAVPGLETVRD
jgi:signal transduction histidine kinase